MNPGAGDQFFRTNLHKIHQDGSMFNDRGNASPFPSTTSTDSLPESLQFSEDSLVNAGMNPIFFTQCIFVAENKKAQNRWSKEEKKLIVQLWVEKHDQLES